MTSCVRPGVLTLAAALLSAAAATAWSGDAEGSPAAAEPAGRNAAGAATAVIWQPFGFDDAYSWMAGAGVFYERRQRVLGAPLVLGARVGAYAQDPLQPGFERSFTLLAGSCIGWELLHSSGSDLQVSLVPYAGYLQYWRWLRHDGEQYLASRPIAVFGIGFDLAVGKRVLFGLAVEPMLIMDRTPLESLSLVQRLGVRF